MITHDEPWQVFSENGEAVVGASASRDEFNQDPSLIVGASQVWLWQRSLDGIEVLLQKRASTKKAWPGCYEASVAGHIDASESPVESAVREAREELGVDMDAGRLIYLFSLRTPLAESEIDHVYAYEVDADFVAKFADGEVESVEWMPLSVLRERLKSPDEFKIVNQGNGYFSLLLDYLTKL